MNSTLLRWLANGTISLVLVSTLWLVNALQPDAGTASVFQLAVAATPAQSAQGASAAKR